jgi:hypothetical protein
VEDKQWQLLYRDIQQRFGNRSAVYLYPAGVKTDQMNQDK